MSASCRSCEAEMEWAVSTVGARLPLDPGVLDRGPRARDVVLYVPRMRAKVIGQADIDSGDAVKWLAAPGCELRSSHWETCGGAAQHRAGFVRPGQESMGL